MSDEEQCPTCNRVIRDWSKSGVKRDGSGHKVDSLDLPDRSEDRTAPYRTFRRTFGGPCVTDFDQIEWRKDGSGVWIPVALLELTRIDGGRRIPDSYLAAILKRILIRDPQGELAKLAAGRLGCKAWMVPFRHDLGEFWVYNLTDGRGWWHMNATGYQDWIRNLPLPQAAPAVEPAPEQASG
jgi:hypothetical protein